MIYTRPGEINPHTVYVCDDCGRQMRLDWQGRDEEQLLQRATERGWTIQGQHCFCPPELCGQVPPEPGENEDVANTVVFP